MNHALNFSENKMVSKWWQFPFTSHKKPYESSTKGMTPKKAQLHFWYIDLQFDYILHVNSFPLIPGELTCCKFASNPCGGPLVDLHSTIQTALLESPLVMARNAQFWQVGFRKNIDWPFVLPGHFGPWNKSLAAFIFLITYVTYVCNPQELF